MDVKDLRIGMWVNVNDCETPYPLQVAEIRRISGSYYAELYNEQHNKRLTCIVDKINCEVQPIDESSVDMFDNLRFGGRFKTRSGIDAIFLFKNGRFLNFVIDKKTRDELYLEEIVTDLKGFVDNPNNPCDNDIVERIY